MPRAFLTGGGRDDDAAVAAAQAPFLAACAPGPIVGHARCARCSSRATRCPYCGFSAGAAIAARDVLAGG